MSIGRQSSRGAVGEATVAGALAVVVGVAVSQAPAAMALGVPIVASALCLGGLLRALRDPGDPAAAAWVGRLTLLSFVAHLVLGLLILQSDAAVEALGGDANTYDFGARAIVDHWNGRATADLTFLQPGKEGFFYGLAALYWLLGPYPAAGLAVNAGLAAGVVPLVHDTTHRLFGRDAARIATLLYVLLPGFLIWTSQLLREAAVVFLLAASANATVRLHHRATPGAVGALVASLAVLFTVRANVALLAAGGFTVGLALGRRRMAAGTVTACVVTLLVLLLVPVAGLGERGFQATTDADLEQVDLARRDLATSAESGIAPDADVSTPGTAMRFLPLGVMAFSFGPFPWTASNVRQLAGVLEALTLWALVPLLVRGWRHARGTIGRGRLVLGIPAAVLTVALSLFVGNYGTVVRERLQVTILLLPLIGCGWAARGRRAGAATPAVSTPSRPAFAASGAGPDQEGGAPQAARRRPRHRWPQPPATQTARRAQPPPRGRW